MRQHHAATPSTCPSPPDRSLALRLGVARTNFGVESLGEGFQLRRRLHANIAGCRAGGLQRWDLPMARELEAKHDGEGRRLDALR